MKSLSHEEIADALRSGRSTIPFVGVYDVLSASIASRFYQTIFVSGFGFSASHYGLPDAGFLTWTDLVDFVRRIRRVSPAAALLVDIDDGFGDPANAANVALSLEDAGAFGVVLEDQRRPKKCGHLPGKEILSLEEYLPKLSAILEHRRSLFVVARTDASEAEEVERRIKAFEQAGADAVLVDGLRDLETLSKIRNSVNVPICYNQIGGGNSPGAPLGKLRSLGVNLAIFSTPALFSSIHAVSSAMQLLRDSDNSLSVLEDDSCNLAECQQLLESNLDSSTSGKLD